MDDGDEIEQRLSDSDLSANTSAHDKLRAFREQAFADLVEFGKRTKKVEHPNHTPSVIFETVVIPPRRIERPRGDEPDDAGDVSSTPGVEICYEFPPRPDGEASWFWPTYDYALNAPTAGVDYYFRHYCRRKLILTYDRGGTNTITVVQAYSVSALGVDTPISWYFVPTSAALEELIAAATFTVIPPAVHLIKMTITMEMHRQYFSNYTIDMGSGFKIHTGANYVANNVGDETTSVPAVSTVCYKQI